MNTTSGVNILATAFEGKDGWLFLGDDSNGSVRQFTGEVILKTDVRQKWSDLINVGRGLVGDDRYAFLISPSKENVFPEYYPHTRGGESMAQQFARIGSDRILDPTERLADTSIFHSYDKEETHWNDWGSYIAYRQLMQHLNLEAEDIPADQFELADFPGADLGTKMQPPIVGSTIKYKGPGRENLKYHNGINNWGNLSVYENEAAPIKKTLLFFGDSFGTKVMKFLSTQFTRAVFAHATSIDLGIIRRERPHYLINEVTDRFLPFFQATPRDFIFNALVKSKIASMSNADERASLIARHRIYFPEFSK